MTEYLRPDGEKFEVKKDGTVHQTVYSPEENTRVSVDYDSTGKEVPGSLHYTDQSQDKGTPDRHNY